MTLRKPKSVYVQIRTGNKPKKFKNFTVYGSTFEQVTSKVSKVLDEPDGSGSRQASATTN